MRVLGIVLATLFAALFWSSASLAAEPAFDCAKAESSAEKLICSNDELAALDRKLAEIYGGAVDVVKSLDAGADEALNTLKAYQRGWVKGRDECWKGEDELACLKATYERRIAELTARYQLIKGQAPVFYTCNGNPADEIVATFFPTEPPSARLERGDTTEIAVQGLSGSGARYEGDFGIVFWIKGNDAMVEWPQGTSFDCKVRAG
ncbi:MliC family protein [Roseibium sediminicola]|uniref:MliC family protein n=1 Tax=Roseibium sediminicola TaxID=2933272 RepID=A0ABT0GZ49_9HYPH|nr:MliC family protein [Roseibium sp. CAU 1639]MCK7614707.1 MliC family protein [Roseibium sp. CAU 1639]